MKYNARQLKIDLMTKRCILNDFSLDEAAKQIGISKATLSRIENLKTPDIETFGKICKWLETEPNDYFKEQ
jgi:DNA-binding Xre family transcriptional regulator